MSANEGKGKDQVKVLITSSIEGSGGSRIGWILARALNADILNPHPCHLYNYSSYYLTSQVQVPGGIRIYIYQPVHSLLKAIKALHPDILLICSISEELIMEMPEIPKVTVPVVHLGFNLYELSSTQPGLLPILSQFLSQAAHIIAPSRYAYDLLKGIGLEDITLIPQGIFIEDYYNELGWEQRRNDILVVGRCKPIKGWLTAILAMPAILQEVPDARLILVGPGEELGQPLLNLARSLGVSYAIQALGELDHEEVKELYKTSKVLLHPSFSEIAPLAVLEALASGLPVVGSGCTVHQELNQAVFDVDDPPSAAKAIIALLTDRETWERAQQSTLDESLMFDIRDRISSYQELFKQLLEVRKRIFYLGGG